MVEIPTTFSVPGPVIASHSIRRKPASNVWHAFNFANGSGQTFNTFVTLNCAHTGCNEYAMSATFRALLDRRFGPWWRRPSRALKLGPQGRASFVWVAENSDGTHHGIHFAAYIPAARRADFEKRFSLWVADLFDGITAANAIHITDIDNAAGLRKYLLKGTEPAYAAFCAINHIPQGVIYGKRSGVSRSLQRAARLRANYQGRRSRSNWRSLPPGTQVGATAPLGT